MNNSRAVKFSEEIENIMNFFMKHFHSQVPEDLADCEMTAPQFLTMRHLFNCAHCKMSDLARALGVTMGNITTMVDRLVRAGFVSRFHDPDDRRVVRASLTKKGREISSKIMESKKKVMMKIFEKVPDKDKKSLLKVMKKVADLINQERGNKDHG